MAFYTGALLLVLASPALAVPVPGSEETRCATMCPSFIRTERTDGPVRGSIIFRPLPEVMLRGMESRDRIRGNVIT